MIVKSSHFYQLLSENARAAEIPLFGAFDLRLLFESPRDLFELQRHFKKYDDWLKNGSHAEMEYLDRGREYRFQPEKLLPGIQSIFCVGLPYNTRPFGQVRSPGGPRLARYLRGEDYHRKISCQLQDLMIGIEKTCIFPQLKWKIAVDTSAVLERTWATFAGLGWIGKNTMLIHPKFGSYFFIGVVYINEPTGIAPRLLPKLCGSCVRCLQGCPTQALDEKLGLESSRCISYLTIEKKGEWKSFESELMDKPLSAPWIAGCDICQEVCPFNLKPSKGSDPSPSVSDFEAWSWDEWAALDESGYQQLTETSAMKRIKFKNLRRNILRGSRPHKEDLVVQTYHPCP